VKKLHLFSWLACILVLAVVFAQLEIQIEGCSGWASALPTWRRTPQQWPALNLLWGGRPLTGYHLWAFTCVALFFHLPFAMLWRWDLGLEARALGSTMLFWIVEDALWFLLNPHFRLSGFRPGGGAWWHPHWLLGLPADYWVFGLLGLGLVWLSFRPSRSEPTIGCQETEPGRG
jgi:hypothetical protein